jgi:hypothetical protein
MLLTVYVWGVPKFYQVRCLGIVSVNEELKKRKLQSDSKGVLFFLDFRGHIEGVLRLYFFIIQTVTPIFLSTYQVAHIRETYPR